MTPKYACFYEIEGITHEGFIRLTNGGEWSAIRFELIRRAQPQEEAMSQPQTTPEEPLVKWPKEEDEPVRRFGQLKPGDIFAFKEWPQDVRMRVHENGCIRLFGGNKPDGCVLRYSDDYLVRRLKLVRPPLFEVV